MSNENFENSPAADEGAATDNSVPKVEDFIIRIRGLPWSSSKDDIVKFFSECKIKDAVKGVHMTLSREGRPSGLAYVEFEDEEDVEKALKKDREHIGQRYIEVFRCEREEMDMALRQMNVDGEEGFNDVYVRLRGLPFECSKEEIAHFFTGLEIVRNGISLPTDYQGRSTGEAFVQFASQDIAEKALSKHKEKIGHRYIEIFKSSLQEVRNASEIGGPMRVRNMGGSNRFDPYDRMDRRGGRNGMPRGRFGGRNEPIGGLGGGDHFGSFGQSRERWSTGHRVHMRGLPYNTTEQDINEFFKPLNPALVNILFERSGRPSGEADVEFFCHEEAVKAMKKDKEKIQHRYIELFLHSEAKPFRNEMEPYAPNEGSPFGPGMDKQFGPGDRGFGSNGYGGFSSSNRPFGGPVADRGFGSSRGSEMSSYKSASGGYGYTVDRGPSAEGFGSSERHFTQTAQRYGPAANVQPYNVPGDRYASSGERSFAPATGRWQQSWHNSK